MRPPLNLGQTLDAAFKIVGARWRTLAAVVAAVVVPVELLSFLVTLVTADSYDAGGPLGGVKTGGGGTAAAGAAIVFTLSIVGSLLGTVACYRAVADTYAGRPTSPRASLRFAGERLGPALWLTLLVALGVLAGAIACLVPGVWLAIAWSVALPVLLVEGQGGTAALRRSSELVRGRWWATFARLCVAYILVFVTVGIVSSILRLPVVAIAGSDSVAALAMSHVAGALTSMFTTPLIAAVTVLVYFDLRTRKEGFDPGAPAPDGESAEPPPPAADTGGPWLPPAPPQP